MATTIVHKYTEPLVMDAEQIREMAQEWLEQARGDEDKAGDVDDCTYYEGNANALEALLKAMTGQTETPEEAVHNDVRDRHTVQAGQE
jgi:hypothetical protein